MNRKHIFNSNATPQRFYSHGENFKQVVVAVINTYACNLTSEIRHTYVVLGEHLGYSDTRIAPRPLARLGDMISFRFCHIPSSIYSCSIDHILEHEFCHLGCWAVLGQ